MQERLGLRQRRRLNTMMVDTMSDAFYVLAKEKNLGNFASGLTNFANSMKVKSGVI